MTALTTDVLILASGKSSRYISRTKKQNIKINGISIVDIAISNFIEFKQIRDIYLITNDLSLINKSKYKDKFKTLFTKLEFFKIENAGHWLHVEKPKEFIELISKKLI